MLSSTLPLKCIGDEVDHMLPCDHAGPWLGTWPSREISPKGAVVFAAKEKQLYWNSLLPQCSVELQTENLRFNPMEKENQRKGDRFSPKSTGTLAGTAYLNLSGTNRALRLRHRVLGVYLKAVKLTPLVNRDGNDPTNDKQSDDDVAKRSEIVV